MANDTAIGAHIVVRAAALELDPWTARRPLSSTYNPTLWNAARLLRADSRIGLVAGGFDANLLLVDGDPTKDISATERISTVVFKGERIRRTELFDENKNPY